MRSKEIKRLKEQIKIKDEQIKFLLEMRAYKILAETLVNED